MKKSNPVSCDPSITGTDSSILIWAFSSLNTNRMASKHVLYKTFQTSEMRPYRVYQQIAITPF